MDAELANDERIEVAPFTIAELVIWKVPQPVSGSNHLFKYRLALVSQDVAVLRYDNEAGKGDHRHVGRREYEYDFRGYYELLDDFWKDVERWLSRSSD